MQPIDWIYRTARLCPEALAVDTPSGSLRYRELMGRVDAFAAALQSAEPSPRARIAVCAHNTVEHLIAILAVMASGNVWVPLNPRDARDELRTKLAIARPSLIVADEDCLELVEHADAHLVIGKSSSRAADTMAQMISRASGKRPQKRAADNAQTQALKFTGGSSGRPKGVLQPYRAWVAGAINMLHAFQFNAADRFLLAAPLTHGTSCYVTPILTAGGTLVLLGERTTPEAILQAFAHRRITATFLPPTLIYMLLSRLDSGRARCDSLRLLIYGAAPMPADRVREAQAAFGPVVAANYGLTEAPQIITVLTPGEAGDERLASAGRAGLMTRVEITAKDGAFSPPGESGEIVVGGDLVMTGYLNLPGQSEDALRDGWLHTGDLGHLDDRGYLYITDRIKDMVITGGFNVYPGEVERVLAAHPAVHECVVFGVADPKWGEAVHAAVTLRDGAKPEPAELIAFARARIGSVKAPKQIHFLHDFPRSPVGKVQRRKVRDLVQNRGGG